MKKIILGTDWWTDCDDAAAIRMLCRAHINKEIELLGIIINACNSTSVRSLSAFLTSEGVNVPIGLDFDATDFSGNPSYHQNLCKLSSLLTSNDDAFRGVELYRKLLSENDDIDIIEIGYLNTIADLLDSKGDKYSDKSGTELLFNKSNRIWCMAGKWDENPGKENNFSRNKRAASGGSRFLQKCPAEIIFLGFECGINVISGSDFNDGDVLKNIFFDHKSFNGRPSWDPLTVALALGYLDKSDYDLCYGNVFVDSETGYNYFEHSNNSRRCYVKLTKPYSYYVNIINNRIC